MTRATISCQKTTLFNNVDNSHILTLAKKSNLLAFLNFWLQISEWNSPNISWADPLSHFLPFHNIDPNFNFFSSLFQVSLLGQLLQQGLGSGGHSRDGRFLYSIQIGPGPKVCGIEMGFVWTSMIFFLHFDLDLERALTKNPWFYVFWPLKLT